MPTQRESLDTNFKAADRIAPSRHATGINRYAVICGTCGDTFFVDEKTYRFFERALEFDASDNTFTCVECEAQETDEEHR
ncbi:MAG TPA: hypothetical protein PLF26_07555 [Blastocatellia bacterium]|nr:hypothetical protein [Blastocatellia bacterium]